MTAHALSKYDFRQVCCILLEKPDEHPTMWFNKVQEIILEVQRAFLDLIYLLDSSSKRV